MLGRYHSSYKLFLGTCHCFLLEVAQMLCPSAWTLRVGPNISKSRGRSWRNSSWAARMTNWNWNLAEVMVSYGFCWHPGFDVELARISSTCYTVVAGLGPLFRYLHCTSRVKKFRYLQSVPFSSKEVPGNVQGHGASQSWQDGPMFCLVELVCGLKIVPFFGIRKKFDGQKRK